MAVWSSTWGSTPSFVVPDGVLSDGVRYHWTIAASSAYGYPACAAPRSFTVDRRLGVSGPAPREEVGPVSVNLGSGNVTTAAGSHSVESLGGDIGVGFVYNSQATSTRGLRASYHGGTFPEAQASPPLNFDAPPFNERRPTRPSSSTGGSTGRCSAEGWTTSWPAGPGS